MVDTRVLPCSETFLAMNRHSTGGNDKFLLNKHNTWHIVQIE